MNNNNNQNNNQKDSVNNSIIQINKNNINKVNNLNPKLNTPNININYNKNNNNTNIYNQNNFNNNPAYGKNSRLIENSNKNNNNNFKVKDENLANMIFDENLLNINSDIINRKLFYFLQKIKIEKDYQDGDDWGYLKKTVSKDGKYISDDFIRYNQITDKLVDDEDEIINNHMNIIKVINIFLIF